MQAFNYLFNIGGNFTATMKGMTSSTGEFSAKVESATGVVGRMSQKLMQLEVCTGYIEKLNDSFNSLSEAGIALDSQMHDLSAVAGVTGDKLKEIEGYARESAKTFGTDAATAVEGYKLLLSQLTPELGKCPDALKSMGESIQITSKLMNNDGVAAAEVLTTAMNQYGVSLDNPMEASRKMAEMMNVMAAAGQEGSAELPQIKAALQQCGMAAKAANVAFEETNAAIQVLDKAGKKGSEGGVALRNVLGTLSQGRFLPKDTQEALKSAGVDITKLADTTLPLKTRLELLNPLLNDAALFSKLFGTENANAARALVQGTDELGRLTTAITGTNSAEQQAAIVMESYAEKQARINQQIADFKISIFQAIGNLGIWASAFADVAIPIAQLVPLIEGTIKLINWTKGLNWAGMWSSIKVQLALMVGTMDTGSMISLGFIGNIGRATLALLHFGTVGVFNALKGIGAYILSLITGGTASATFSTIASTSFAAFGTSARIACAAVSTAIMNIPVIGWIIAVVAALIALGAYFWNTSVKFRAVLKGLWASFKTFFTSLWDLAKNTFGALGDLIKAAFELNPEGMSAALNKFKNAYSDFGKQVGSAFSEAYNAEIAANQEKNAQEEGKKEADSLSKGITMPQIKTDSGGYGSGAGSGGVKGNVTGSSLKNVGGNSVGSSGGSIRNITISIDKLVERLEVHTTNLKEGASEIKALVSQCLMEAVNDVNLAQR